MSTRGFKIGVMLMVLLFLVGCGKGEQAEEVVTELSTVSEEAERVSPETPKTEEPVADEETEELPVVYADDELINLYLNRFNEANIDTQIEGDDFEVYYHHGQEHKDQISLNVNGFESVIVSAKTGSKVEIVLDGGETEEAYKQAFMLYARGYNPELEAEMLEDYWKQVIENSSRFTQFEEFEVEVSRYSDTIEYLGISGEVK